MVNPRGILIAGNWKMNHGPQDTAAFFDDLDLLLKNKPEIIRALGSGLSASIIPPAVSLGVAASKASGFKFPIRIAAQNAHWEKKGAFTGEVSGPMLLEMGVNWTLVGHSERRQFFGETDETVKLRAESLLGQGFQVILCIGETRSERESGQTEAVLARQIQTVLGEGSAKDFLDGRLIFAYEPVWAIGTGLTATTEQINRAHRKIRNLIEEAAGPQAGERTPILYGGSVTPENCESILHCPDVDGALVGGASLTPAGFMALLQAGANCLNARAGI